VEERGKRGKGHTGFGFGEAVGLEDLVQEGGDGVEEADVDAEGDEDEVERWTSG